MEMRTQSLRILLLLAFHSLQCSSINTLSTESSHPPIANSYSGPLTSNLKADLDQDTLIISPVKDLAMPMVLAVKGNFTEDLKNKNSSHYMKLGKELHGYLTTILNTTKGFRSVEITEFRKGRLSVVAMYIIHLFNLTKEAALTEVKHVLDETASNFRVAKSFNLKLNFIMTLQLLPGKIQDFESASACTLYERACPIGYYNCSSVPNFSSMVSCKKKCSSENPPCGVNGECFVHYKDEEIKCRCRETDSHVYSGQFCEIATEKLKLKSNTIIIIGTSSGGAMLLIITFLFVCIVRSNLRNRRPNRIDDDRFESESMNDLHSFELYDGRRSRSLTFQNSYDSGLPDTKVVDGREHRLVKDGELGSKAYIYPPPLSTTMESQNEDENPSQRSGSVYGHIATDKQFEIQRPNMRHGSIDSYW